MNQFEERINALRLQHKAERAQIQKDCDELFTRLNRVIETCGDADARRILRAEKFKVYVQTHRSLRWEAKCYHQQLSVINAEYQAYREKHVSSRQAHKAVATLHRYAMQLGEDNKRIALSLGESIKSEIIFE